MKKNSKTLAVISVAICLLLSGKTFTDAGNSAVQVLYNSMPIVCEQPSMIVGETVILPIRAVYEALGYNVFWQESIRCVDITGDGFSLRMWEGAKTVLFNQKEIAIDAAPLMVNGRLMHSISAFKTILTEDISWNSEMRVVNISTEIASEDIASKEAVYYDFYTLFLNENFDSDEVDSAWVGADGALELAKEGKNGFVRFADDIVFASHPVLKPTPKDGKLTVNYLVRNGDYANTGGIYFLDNNGNGCGLLAQLDPVRNTVILLVRTDDNGRTYEIISEQEGTTVSGKGWHTVTALWDMEERTFTLFLDGAKLGEVITGVEQESFMRVGLYAEKAALEIDDIRINTTPESSVVALSWWSPIGAKSSRLNWGTSGYNYMRHKSATNDPTTMDYPLPPEGVDMPTHTPVIGSDEYYELYYEASLHYDLPLMKEAGFSAMAFDIQADPGYDPDLPITMENAPFVNYTTLLKSLLPAAEVLGGIKVGLFTEGGGANSDYPNGYTLSPTDWVNLYKAALDNLPDSKAVWKIMNRPVIMHFGNVYYLRDTGVTPHFGWYETLTKLRGTHDFYYIADVNPWLEDYGKWAEVIDAAYGFVPSGPRSYMSGTKLNDQIGNLNVFATQREYPQIPYHVSSAPGYYRIRSVYTPFDFDRIHEVYMAAIDSKASSMVMTTWNDFEEDTGIVPSARNGRSLLDIYAFYNTWLKTGVQPAVEEENITIGYPVSIPLQMGTKVMVWSDVPEPDYFKTRNPDTGRVFYWANLKTEKTLTINGKDTITIPAGLSFGEMPEGVGAGSFKAEITENGKTTRFDDLPSVRQIANEPEEGRVGQRYVRLK